MVRLRLLSSQFLTSLHLIRVSTFLAIPKVLIFIFFLSLDLQDRQKTVYDIPVMIYLKNL